jgi:hypothetical protein
MVFELDSVRDHDGWSQGAAPEIPDSHVAGAVRRQFPPLYHSVEAFLENAFHRGTTDNGFWGSRPGLLMGRLGE